MYFSLGTRQAEYGLLVWFERDHVIVHLNFQELIHKIRRLLCILAPHLLNMRLIRLEVASRLVVRWVGREWHLVISQGRNWTVLFRTDLLFVARFLGYSG